MCKSCIIIKACTCPVAYSTVPCTVVMTSLTCREAHWYVCVSYRHDAGHSIYELANGQELGISISTPTYAGLVSRQKHIRHKQQSKVMNVC